MVFVSVAFTSAAAPLVGHVPAVGRVRTCRASTFVGAAARPMAAPGGRWRATRPASPAMKVEEGAEPKTKRAEPSSPAGDDVASLLPTVPAVADSVAGNGVTVDGAETKEGVAGDVYKTIAWVAAAGAVAAGVAYWLGPERGLEFVAAYVVEYSLSVDNLFVFLLLFQYFQVPRPLQTRVLNYGIIGAMTMRGVMIVAGEALTQRFEWVTLAFAGILLFSAAKLLFAGGEEEDDVENNAVVKFARGLLPFSNSYDGDRFFTTPAEGQLGAGTRLATPLMLVLLSVELSDVVFALDSVPAVLGISNSTFVIYASNILAILGLRSLFFVLADAIGDLRFLQPALAVVLGFVGAKMIGGVAGYEVGILPSLGIIGTTLGGGVGASLLFPAVEGDGADK